LFQTDEGSVPIRDNALVAVLPPNRLVRILKLVEVLLVILVGDLEDLEEGLEVRLLDGALAVLHEGDLGDLAAERFGNLALGHPGLLAEAFHLEG
jgi:hypothetical protein